VAGPCACTVATLGHVDGFPPPEFGVFMPVTPPQALSKARLGSTNRV
jgi:hypothetical protein